MRNLYHEHFGGRPSASTEKLRKKALLDNGKMTTVKLRLSENKDRLSSVLQSVKERTSAVSSAITSHVRSAVASVMSVGDSMDERERMLRSNLLPILFAGMFSGVAMHQYGVHKQLERVRAYRMEQGERDNIQALLKDLRSSDRLFIQDSALAVTVEGDENAEKILVCINGSDDLIPRIKRSLEAKGVVLRNVLLADKNRTEDLLCPEDGVWLQDDRLAARKISKEQGIHIPHEKSDRLAHRRRLLRILENFRSVESAHEGLEERMTVILRDERADPALFGKTLLDEIRERPEFASHAIVQIEDGASSNMTENRLTNR